MYTIFCIIFAPIVIVAAIKLAREMDGLGTVGYVANSPFTVLGESMSAGRMYDKIGDTGRRVVKYVLPQGILCELMEENG